MDGVIVHSRTDVDIGPAHGHMATHKMLTGVDIGPELGFGREEAESDLDD